MTDQVLAVKPRVRFAPSPTGYLHVGGARTALFNWLFAKHFGGTFVLRIEDTDTKRSTPEAVSAIFEGMEWLGLTWDEGPGVEVEGVKYFQTERLDIYHKYVQQLLKDGKAYPCFKHGEELEKLKADAEAKGIKSFQRSWETYTPAEMKKLIKEKKPFSVRFKSPMEGEITVNDLVLGDIKFNVADSVDDFVILKMNGVPTYNFAVVIDDATMNITHVFRGDDHLSNTPKQIAVYDALGLTKPLFGHIPMILGADKKKLSKRHGATSVTQYRDDGYLPHALLNHLVRLGWSHGDQETFTLEQMIEYFDGTHLNKTASVFDPSKLNSISTHYMREASAKDLIKNTNMLQLLPLALPDISVGEAIRKQPANWFISVVELLKGRSTNLVHLVDQSRYFFQAPIKLDEKAVEKLYTPENLQHLKALVEGWQKLEVTDWDLDTQTYAEANGVKLSVLAQMIRLAVTGGTVSPPIFETLALIGKGPSLARLANVLQHVPAK